MDRNDPVHWHIDEGVAGGILELLRGKSVADVCGGVGLWTQWWHGRGLNVHCFDGIPDIENLTKGLVSHLDISEHIPNPRKFDWVVCLEALEHIPQDHEETALNNLCNMFSEGIVLSWAIPGQSGFGHCNCQPNTHAIDWFTKNGCLYCEDDSRRIRARSADVYKDTVMVFRTCNS